MLKTNNKINNAIKKAVKDKNATIVKDKIDGLVKDQKWEDLEEIYQTTAKGLVEMGQYLSLCLSLDGVTDYVEDKVHLDNLVKCVTSDITSFAKELTEVRKQHLNKTGPIENETELFICINIFQDYQSLNTKLYSVITPNHMESITILNEANEKMLKEKEMKKENVDETIENKTEKEDDK